MAQWDKNRGVLVHKHTKFWQHQIRDVDGPNLQRDVFPYKEVTRTDFDFKIVVPSPAKAFLITDSTFRDGQQARPPYTVEQIVHIFELLHRLGGPNGVIRQSEFFLYSNKDKAAVERCRELGHAYPEVTGWIRANKEDLAIVKEMGLRETGILTSVSDYHIFYKLKMKRVQAADFYLGIVKEALSAGIVPRCHFEDITRSDIYGFCVPFAIELMKLREESGIDIKVRMCDTLGFGVTYPGAALPRSVPKLVRTLIEEAGVPGHLLEWHGHNDFHKGFINATTSWLYGCGAVNGTLLGFGERTGNTPIEGLIIEHISLTGKTNGIDTRVITEIAHYFESDLDYHIPSNYPFVGADFNATSAGVHADGLIKNEEIYNIFDTEKILGRPIDIIVTDKSGTAGIAHWINTHLDLAEGEQVDKTHPGIIKIHKSIQRQYEQGRVTSISKEEMTRLAHKYLPDYFVSTFDKLKAGAYDLAAHLVERLIQLPEIRSMDPAKQEPVLETCLETNPHIQFIYITDKQGLRTTKNITQIVDKAKYKDAVIGEDLSDRSWFINPMKDGRVHVTNFYLSKYSGYLCITVSGPVRNDQDEIVGVLGTDMRFEDLVKMEKNGELS
ncbi:MAG: histone-lysine N-methyltransferase [Deltaproteobacteria bacterium]|nr:histone-lysine N-methyltransferase [Deltaproteobacteria bacterium]MBW2073423.1 histone-lysine N-methyltransferase [Deltaproteobacteria bacterium]RLB83980.1 MAG: histone-lysine N-methyltransferase [Deltaproteobacteria bacterium]